MIVAALILVVSTFLESLAASLTPSISRPAVTLDISYRSALRFYTFMAASRPIMSVLEIT